MDVPVSDAILVIYLNILSFLAFFRDKRTEEDPGEGCVEEAGTAVEPPFSALFGLSWALGALQCFGHTTGKAEFKQTHLLLLSAGRARRRAHRTLAPAGSPG